MHSYSSVSISTCDSDHALLGMVYHHRLKFDTVYLRAKFDDSSFSHSRDTIGATKFKVGHMTLTMPLSRVICHPYART